MRLGVPVPALCSSRQQIWQLQMKSGIWPVSIPASNRLSFLKALNKNGDMCGARCGIKGKKPNFTPCSSILLNALETVSSSKKPAGKPLLQTPPSHTLAVSDHPQW